jgi:hypothetical protein
VVALIESSGTVPTVENVQVTVTAGFPATVGDAVVVFEQSVRHTNTFSVIVRVIEEDTTLTQELYRGDQLELPPREGEGSWILTGLRDAAGNGVHRLHGDDPVTAVFRRILPGDYNQD